MTSRGPSRQPTRPQGNRTRIAEPVAPPPAPHGMMSDDSGPVITLEPPAEPIEPANFTGERNPRNSQRFGTIGGTPTGTIDEDAIDIPTFLRPQTHTPG